MDMIIWSGLGFLVAVIAFVSMIFAEYTTESLFQDDSYYQTHGWPKLLAFWIAGVTVWFLGNHLNQKPGQVMIDKETGTEVLMKPNHALFFIKLEYWGPILFILGILFLFVKT
jgi:hypothetical protein